MNLSQLSPIVEKKKRRAGQGHGSGRVKTSDRGTKGQKARRNIPMRFEGGALPLVKRLPFL
ncbi:MAG: uL15 family ribosomal protein, partial [Candidatus Levyibacteriota bacterium]